MPSCPIIGHLVELKLVVYLSLVCNLGLALLFQCYLQSAYGVIFPCPKSTVFKGQGN